MPEMFESLMFAARREIIVTTPYYVPDESLHSALCTTAYRGVDTTIVFPARNDSWIVGAASRSYYADLLAAGVKIYEYEGGLLHTKSLTLDGEITLDRLGEHGPPQLRAQLREQHPVPRSRTYRCSARAPAGIHCPVASGHEGGGGGLADVAPAVEQPHCHARARALIGLLIRPCAVLKTTLVHLLVFNLGKPECVFSTWTAFRGSAAT